MYFDPRKPDSRGKYEFEPIYVGIGSGNRHLDHLRRKDVHPLTAKIGSLRKKNLEPIIVKIKENLTLDKAKQLEKHLISSIGRKILNEGTLLNISGGGEGNFDPPPEVRKKLASYGMQGKKHSEESKRMIGISNAEHPTMKSRGRQLGLSNIGRKTSNDVKLKISNSIRGDKNPRAKVWTIDVDDGTCIQINGILKEWCKSIGISYYFISKYSPRIGNDGRKYTLRNTTIT